MTIKELTYLPDVLEGLLSESKWDISSSNQLSYSFPGLNSWFRSNYGNDEPEKLLPFAESQRQSFDTIIRLVESYTPIDFTKANESIGNYGTIRVAFSEVVGESGDWAGWAYYPNNADEGGDIWINPIYSDEEFDIGSGYYTILMHELGHALGLSHSFEAVGPFPAVPAKLDSTQYTMMSYTNDPDYDGYPTTFMPLDIAALQYLYGANTDYNSADTTYLFKDDSSIQTIWDGGGTDLFDFSALTAGVDVSLGQGAFISERGSSDYHDPKINNFAIAYGTEIEGVIGSNRADILKGNDLDNTIEGRGGDDWIEVFTGANTVDGGAGTDTLKLPGNSEDWSWSFTEDTNIAGTIGRNLATADEIQLENVEILQFDDSELLFATIEASNTNNLLEDNAIPGSEQGAISTEQAQIYRLYLGALSRLPDEQGFAWWTDKLHQGTSMDEIAKGFYWSEEFQTKADTDKDQQVSSNELLDHLYENVLERQADEAGYVYWLDQLEAGSLSPEQVLRNFTESDEYILLSSHVVSDFDFWV